MTDLAAAIDTFVSRAHEVRDGLVECGKLLAECKRLAIEDGRDWNAVLEQDIKPRLHLVIKERQIRRLIEIGNSDNPEEAAAEKREANRKAVAKSRRNADLRKSSIPNDPMGRALHYINPLTLEQKAQVVEVAGHDVRKALAPPEPPIRERLRRLWREASDDDIRAVLSEPENWARLGRLLDAEARTTPPHDPETGEIIEARDGDGPVPAGRKASAPEPEASTRSPGPDGAPQPPAGPATPDDPFFIPAELRVKA